MKRIYAIALIGGLPSGGTLLMSLTAVADDPKQAREMAMREMEARVGANLKFHGDAVSDITEEAAQYLADREADHASTS